MKNQVKVIHRGAEITIAEDQIWGDGEYRCRVWDVSEQAIGVRYNKKTHAGNDIGWYEVDDFVRFWKFRGDAKVDYFGGRKIYLGFEVVGEGA